MRHLAGELPASQQAEYGFLSLGDAIDLYVAAKHYEDAVVRISMVKEHFARCSVPLAAEIRKARDLGIVQLREHRFKLFGGFRHLCSE